MAQVINPPIMNVTFEHPTIIFDNKIAEVIIEFVNHILYADSEETLRQIVADFADKYDLDRYFVYGYGSHHLCTYSGRYPFTFSGDIRSHSRWLMARS